MPSNTRISYLDKDNQSIRPLVLIGLLVVFLHILVILGFERPDDQLVKQNSQPVPFKLEVSLLTKNSNQSIAALPTRKPTPLPKPKQKAEPKKVPIVKEKSVDMAEVVRLIKANSVKELTKSINHSPGQQTAQEVSAAMVMPSSGQTSAKDNFPDSDMRNPSPEYPEMAVFLDYQGDTIIRIKVSPKGQALGVEVLNSSGHKILDDSALKALKRWRFNPSKETDTSMANSVIITVSYVLYH